MILSYLVSGVCTWAFLGEHFRAGFVIYAALVMYAPWGWGEVTEAVENLQKQILSAMLSHLQPAP